MRNIYICFDRHQGIYLEEKWPVNSLSNKSILFQCRKIKTTTYPYGQSEQRKISEEANENTE